MQWNLSLGRPKSWEMLRIFQAGEKDGREWLRVPLWSDTAWVFRANIQHVSLWMWAMSFSLNQLKTVSTEGEILIEGKWQISTPLDSKMCT